MRLDRLVMGCVLLLMSTTCTARRQHLSVGLDHIPVAVRDLDDAMATYQAMGFVLKPGRPHANGIRNAHVKFPDGSGIELLSVRDSLDALSGQYVHHLQAGDGPAFLALHARDTARLRSILHAGGFAFTSDGDLTALRSPGLSWLFFVRDNRSPTDQPGHFAHKTGALALGTVWIATDEADTLVRLLTLLGGATGRQIRHAPGPIEATVVTLGEGEIVILPASHQLVTGRPVIGAGFRVRESDVVRHLVSGSASGVREYPGMPGMVLIPPDRAHGLWIAFHERTEH